VNIAGPILQASVNTAHFPERAGFVSIILPVYNTARFLGAALQSALNQTYRDLEVIVVNDGSTDGSSEIINRMAALESRIKIVTQENSGVAAARNRGIELATGEFIAPLDSDDLWHPEKISRQLEVMSKSDPDTALVYCWSKKVDESGAVVSNNCWPPFKVEGHVLPALSFLNIVGCGSVPMMRARHLRMVRGYSTKLKRQGCEGCEDWQTYISLSARWKFAAVPMVLVQYRQRADSMSRNLAQMYCCQNSVIEETFAKYPHLPKYLKRWAEARMDRLHAASAMKNRQMIRALRYGSRALIHDPFLMVANLLSSAQRAREAGISGLHYDNEIAPRRHWLIRRRYNDLQKLCLTATAVCGRS